MNVLDEVMNRLTLSEGGTLSVRTCAHATGGETEEGHRMEGHWQVVGVKRSGGLTGARTRGNGAGLTYSLTQDLLSFMVLIYESP